MKRFLTLLLAVGVTALATAAMANGEAAQRPYLPASVDEAVDPAELQARLEALESFDSAFHQAVYSADGSELQAMDGHLSVTRRGEVRWQTEAPYEQLLVADGESIWLYDPDLEQVTVRPFRRNIAETPAMLLIGDTGRLAEEYRVFVIDRGGERGAWQLVPRDRGAMFERIELSFEGAVPSGMTLWDAMEQVTVIRFTDGRANVALDGELFRFEPPPGVDVLHDD